MVAKRVHILMHDPQGKREMTTWKISISERSADSSVAFLQIIFFSAESINAGNHCDQLQDKKALKKQQTQKRMLKIIQHQ